MLVCSTALEFQSDLCDQPLPFDLQYTYGGYLPRRWNPVPKVDLSVLHCLILSDRKSSADKLKIYVSSIFHLSGYLDAVKCKMQNTYSPHV